jgi:hypothetical protein
MYPRSEPGKAVEGGEVLGTLWEEFQAAKARAKEAEAEQKALRSQVLAIIGDAEVALVNGEPILTYKSSKDSEFFAAEIFQQDHPELYREYLRIKPGYRTLREKK